MDGVAEGEMEADVDGVVVDEGEGEMVGAVVEDEIPVAGVGDLTVSKEIKFLKGMKKITRSNHVVSCSKHFKNTSLLFLVPKSLLWHCDWPCYDEFVVKGGGNDGKIQLYINALTCIHFYFVKT